MVASHINPTSEPQNPVQLGTEKDLPVITLSIQISEIILFLDEKNSMGESDVELIIIQTFII